MKKARFVAPVLALACFAGIARAQLLAPAAKPVPAMRMSAVSLDAADKFLTDLGIPHPALTTEMETAPFLGQGVVDASKPIGMEFILTDSEPLMPLEQHLLIAIPLLDGKMTPADLTGKGATPVDGQANTFSMAGAADATLRRSAGYLFVKPHGNNITGLADVKDTAFTDDFKQPGVLGSMEIDIGDVRRDAPQTYKQFFALISSALGQGGGDANITSSIQATYDKFDKLTMTVSQDDANLFLKAKVTPYPYNATVKPMPRPAFPAGMIGELHVLYSDPQMAAQFDQQVDLMTASLAQQMTLDQRAHVTSILKHLAQLFTSSDALSVAVGAKDGKFTIYLVDELNKDVDLPAFLKGISEDAGELGKNMGLKTGLGTYDAGGKTVQRLLFEGDQPQQKVAIDGLEVGKVLYMTVGIMDDSKLVTDLAGLGMKGQNTLSMWGTVDLDALVSALPLPPEIMAQVKPGFVGQKIELKAEVGKEGTVTVQTSEIQVPKQSIRSLVKLITNPPRAQQPVQPILPALP